MPDDKKYSTTLDMELIQRLDDEIRQPKKLPEAPELAQGLMATIDFVGRMVDDRPIRIQDQTTVQESTQQPVGEIPKQPTLGGYALLEGLQEEQQKPATIFNKPVDFRGIRKGEYLSKGSQTELRQIGEQFKQQSKPFYKQVPEHLDKVFSSSVQKINDAFDGKLDSNLIERAGDLALGTVSTGLNVVMTPMHFVTPASEEIGRQVGELTGNEKAGNFISEVLPFSVMPNPLAFYAAAKGSEIVTEEIMDFVNNTELSEKNKERVLEAVGLTTFIATHRAIVKGGKLLNRARISKELKTHLDKEIQSVDKQVLESLKPEKGQVKLGREPRVSREEFEQKITEIKTKKGNRYKDTETGKIISPTKETVNEYTKYHKKQRDLAKDQAEKDYHQSRIDDISTKFNKKPQEVKDALQEEKPKVKTETKKEAPKEEVKTEGGEKITEPHKITDGEYKTKLEGSEAAILYKGKIYTPKEGDPQFHYKTFDKMVEDGIVPKGSKYENYDLGWLTKEGEYVPTNKTHKQYVQDALKEGKKVPEKVLKDYPDLKPTTEPIKGGGILWFDKNSNNAPKISQYGKDLQGLKELKEKTDFVAVDISGKKFSEVKPLIDKYRERYPDSMPPIDFYGETKGGKLTNRIVTTEWGAYNINLGGGLKKGEIYLPKDLVKQPPKKLSKIEQLQKEAIGEVKKVKVHEGEQIQHKIVERKTYEKARTDGLKKLKTGIDPTQISDLVKVGTYHLETLVRTGVKKAVQYTEWSKSMLKEFGQKIKPHLLRIWSGIKKEFGKKLAQIVEHPAFPIKQTKIMEGKFLDRSPFGKEEKPKGEPKKTTSIKNEFVNKERTKRGLQPLKSEFVREWGDVGQDALRQIETGKVNPNKLADDLIKNPRPHTDVEAAILSYEKLRIKEVRNDINRRLADNPKLSKEALELDELYHKNELASNLSGTEVARALNIRKMELQDDYSIAPLLNRARTANGDKVIPQTTRTKLETSSRNIEKTTKKADKLEEQLTEESAKEYVNELTVKEVKKRKQIKRAESKEAIDLKYDDLVKEFAKATQFNALLDPKQIKIMALMTKNRVERGVTSVNDIVDAIHESTKQYVDGLTKRDVLDVIGGYGKHSKLSKTEINIKLRDIKRQARLLSAIDDVKVKQQKPLKSGVERDRLSARVKELQRQLKVEMEKAGLERGMTEASLRKSYETRLKNRRAELQRMLRTGDFTKKPRRSVKMDKDLQKLKDEVDLLKIEADKEIYLLEQANKTKYEKAKELIVEIANIPKSVKSAFDLSAPFRQGAFVLLNHPIIGFRKGGAFREMFKYAVGDKFMRQLKREIKEHPNLPLIKKSGLYLANLESTLGRVLGKEEAFQSHIPEKTPGLKHGIKFSERGYTGFLDKLRFDIFNYKVEQLQRAGYTFKDRPDLYKATAKLINIGTGRGTLGGFEKAARVLSLGLFSPRLIASRLQILTMPLTGYARLPKELRVSAMLDLVRFMGVGTSIAMLGKLAGADVETDVTSSDFMKIKIGNTRIDPWAGLQQPFVLGARLQPFNTDMLSSTGKRIKLDGSEFPFTSKWSVLQRFAESKAAPAAGLIINFLKNKTFMGEDLTAGNVANDLLMPLYLDDLYEAYKIDGMEGAMITAPGFFGVGTQTYKAKKGTTKLP